MARMQMNQLNVGVTGRLATSLTCGKHVIFGSEQAVATLAGLNGMLRAGATRWGAKGAVRRAGVWTCRISRVKAAQIPPVSFCESAMPPHRGAAENR